MSYSWWDLLRVGDGLISDPDPLFKEARLRTVVGRAYYASFHSLCNTEHSLAEFARRRNIRDHGAVLAHLQACGKGEWAGDLRLLRYLRNQCDYDEYVADLQEKAALALTIAHRLMIEDEATELV